ncbi:hypothetical protein L207DRAFT_528173 [Hyaloscypha variabilis F]|uniref:Uncharacterized protein n=1 Tax=Hyaloscypha variabilis (strain UAMH 11265 / GT02V1 / F) TaxID=1149755 RepID=A0A2J6RST0_HYAVF|nr:hypothetical protein L207DRAFT_528173 [Hyaloscypha variabilis F]
MKNYLGARGVPMHDTLTSSPAGLSIEGARGATQEADMALTEGLSGDTIVVDVGQGVDLKMNGLRNKKVTGEPSNAFAASRARGIVRFRREDTVEDIEDDDTDGEYIDEEQSVDEEEIDQFDAAEESSIEGDNTNSADEDDSDILGGPKRASSRRALVVPGKKKQTKPPFKLVRQNPGAKEPEWPEFYQQPLTQQVLANPGGFQKAHQFIAFQARNVAGLKSITKTTGLIKQNGREGVNDWKAAVITHFLNPWILHKHGLVLFNHGAKDHGAQMAWYDSRPQVEKDEYRIWIMPKVEAALQPGDRAKIQNMRNTQEPIVEPLNTSVAAGTWRHPTLGGGMGLSMILGTQTTTSSTQQMNSSGSRKTGGVLGNMGVGHTGGFNGTVGGAHGGPQAVISPRARSRRSTRKRGRDVEDDEHERNEYQHEPRILRKTKKIRQSGGDVNCTNLAPATPDIRHSIRSSSPLPASSFSGNAGSIIPDSLRDIRHSQHQDTDQTSLTEDQEAMESIYPDPTFYEQNERISTRAGIDTDPRNVSEL